MNCVEHVIFIKSFFEIFITKSERKESKLCFSANIHSPEVLIIRTCDRGIAVAPGGRTRALRQFFGSRLAWLQLFDRLPEKKRKSRRWSKRRSRPKRRPDALGIRQRPWQLQSYPYADLAPHATWICKGARSRGFNQAVYHHGTLDLHKLIACKLKDGGSNACRY